MEWTTGTELVEFCNQKKCHIYEAIVIQEQKNYERTAEEIYNQMRTNLQVMRDSVNSIFEDQSMYEKKGKIIGGEAKKLRTRYRKEVPLCGMTMAKAISYALATMETNATMGKIVAAPTAGSCGILPALLLSVEETLSGAEGGCQAEVGSASAMGAAALIEMMEGTPMQAMHGAAIALKNLMGLVCDPIAGLVEAPCSKRNAIGTANALISAEMALAGIESVIPLMK